MTQAKPTPGPVYYGKYEDRVTATSDSDGTDSICHIYGPDPRANGRLIEAAFTHPKGRDGAFGGPQPEGAYA